MTPGGSQVSKEEDNETRSSFTEDSDSRDSFKGKNSNNCKVEYRIGDYKITDFLYGL